MLKYKSTNNVASVFEVAFFTHGVESYLVKRQ